jgi:hypothetical protein
MSDTGSHPKAPTKKAPTKKPKRVSPRKELAVVTFAAVASIAGVAGLLGVHQPASQVAPTNQNVANTSWTSSAHGSRPAVNHTVSQGSKAVVRTGQPTGQPTAPAATATWSSAAHGSHATVSHGSPTVGHDDA